MSVECSDDRKTYPWCRVCLKSNVRMCSIANIRLREIYEKLTSTPQVDHDQGIPQVICFICCSLLRRAHRFSEMAHRSQTILEEMRLQGVEAHQIDVMPDFGIQLMLSVTDNCTISIPNYSNYRNACDLEIVSELQNTVAKVETVCDEEFKLEEIHSTPEEDEIYDDHRDPTHTVPCNEVTILGINLLSEDGVPSSVTDNAMIQNEVVHEIKATEHDLHNKLIKTTSFVRNNTFNEGSPLNPPLRTHIGEKPFKCEICNRAFTVKATLKAHISTHIGEKRFTCEICNKSYTLKATLKTHIRTHTGEKPYKCKICKKAFSRPGSLKKHIRTHTGEKAYKCEICNKTFSQQSGLKFHIRIHTKEKPHKCETCNKTFSQLGSLQSHIRTHTGEKPYECKICKKKFTRKRNIKYHITIHTGEKAYKCEMCNKAFSQRRTLKYHIRSHSGEKAYKCEMCNKAYSQRRSLKYHIRSHSGEKAYKCEMGSVA